MCRFNHIKMQLNKKTNTSQEENCKKMTNWIILTNINKI